jgi:glutathione S-transferase
MQNKYNPSEIILWGVSASPYVRKVMVALLEKNIDYTHKEILPKVLLQATGQAIPEDFNRVSPLGKIPALQIKDFCIADSAVIAGYLDRQFSDGQSLYPKNPEAYARTLWFEHYSDNVLTEIVYKKIFMESVIKPKILNIESNHDLVEQAKKVELPPLLDYLNHAVTKYDWIAGDDFSMADIAIATQLLALKMTDFNLEKWRHLNNYLQKVTARESFKVFS